MVAKSPSAVRRMVPAASTASWASGKLTNPPCSVVPALLVTTGSRQEKSTLVTGRSATVPGLMTGDAVTAVVEGEGLELELTRVADGAQLHAKRTKARIASGRLIVDRSNSLIKVGVSLCPLEPLAPARRRGIEWTARVRVPQQAPE